MQRMKSALVLLSLLILIVLAFACSSGNIEDAQDAYNRGEYNFEYIKAHFGDIEAQFNLGNKYYNGASLSNGTISIKNYDKAAKWYRKAADQGKASAQTRLGLMYIEGQGVPQDYALAHMWFNIAAARSLPGSLLHDEAVKYRESVSALMTTSQIEEAQRLARNWKPR